MNANKKDGFIKSIINFSISHWINFIIGVASAILLTRVFSPDVYGTLNIFNTTVAMLLSIMILGFDSSLIRFYNEPPEGNTSKQLTFKLLVASTFILIIFLIIATLFGYDQFTTKIFGFSSQLICLMVFISVFSQMILRYLNITYRMTFNVKKYTIQSILTQIFTKLFVIFAALASIQIKGVLIINTLGILLLTIFYFIIQRKDIIPKKIEFNYNNYKKIFKFAIFAAPIGIAININIFLSQLIIANSINKTAVGIYASASYFASILSVLQGGFTTYWSAYMYANYNKNQKQIIKVHNFMMFSLLSVLVLMVLLKDFIYLLIGSEYYESKQFFSLVILYPILTIASETTAYGLSIAKKNHIQLINFIFSMGVNLILSIVLTSKIGLIGAAIASAISGVVLFTLNTIWSQKYYKSISRPIQTMIGTLLIILVAIIGTKKQITYKEIIAIGSIVAIAFFVYLKEVKFVVQHFKFLRRN